MGIGVWIIWKCRLAFFISYCKSRKKGSPRAEYPLFKVAAFLMEKYKREAVLAQTTLFPKLRDCPRESRNSMPG